MLILHINTIDVCWNLLWHLIYRILKLVPLIMQTILCYLNDCNLQQPFCVAFYSLELWFLCVGCRILLFSTNEAFISLDPVSWGFYQHYHIELALYLSRLRVLVANIKLMTSLRLCVPFGWLVLSFRMFSATVFRTYRFSPGDHYCFGGNVSNSRTCRIDSPWSARYGFRSIQSISLLASSKPRHIVSRSGCNNCASDLIFRSDGVMK